MHVTLGENRSWLIGEVTVLELSAETWVLRSLQALEQGVTLAALRQIAGDNTDTLLRELLQHHLVVLEWKEGCPPEHVQVAAWLTSVTPDPRGALGRLAKSHVVVVGVGGLGGEVAQHLVASGLGRLTLIDPDVVDASNLNRQFLFDRDDIGLPKVEVASQALRARSPSVEIVSHLKRIAGPADLLAILPPDATLVINCADQPSDIWDVIAMACAGCAVPLITGGTGIDVGYWGPLVTSHHVAWVRAHEAARRRCGGAWTEAYGASRLCQSSFSPRNSIIAACLAADAFTFCSGTGRPRSLEQRQYLNFRTMVCQPRMLLAEDFADLDVPESIAALQAGVAEP